MIDIKIYINKNEVDITSIINVSDVDLIEIEIDKGSENFDSSKDIEIFLEDYKIPYSLSNNGCKARTQRNNLFRESFGYSSLRIFIEDVEFANIKFNVTTNLEKFNQIMGMMSYLISKNGQLLDICLSRTKYKSSYSGLSDASFESIIAFAEKMIKDIRFDNLVLKRMLRSRLEVVKENVNSRNYFNINPYDVIYM